MTTLAIMREEICADEVIRWRVFVGPESRPHVDGGYFEDEEEAREFAHAMASSVTVKRLKRRKPPLSAVAA